MAQVKVLDFPIDIDLQLDWMDGIMISDCNLRPENKPWYSRNVRADNSIAFAKVKKSDEINSTSSVGQMRFCRQSGGRK